jgi:hypothetical protein
MGKHESTKIHIVNKYAGLACACECSLRVALSYLVYIQYDTRKGVLVTPEEGPEHIAVLIRGSNFHVKNLHHMQFRCPIWSALMLFVWISNLASPNGPGHKSGAQV